jgi:hypothetical protein
MFISFYVKADNRMFPTFLQDDYIVRGDTVTGMWPVERKGEFSIRCRLLGQFEEVSKGIQCTLNVISSPILCIGELIAIPPASAASWSAASSVPARLKFAFKVCVSGFWCILSITID